MAKILPQFARWTPAALEVLRDTARRYGAVITTYQLADEVVRRTRIESPTQRRTWIGDLVEVTALAAERAGDPPLTSLCVQRDGTVGDSYVRIVAATTGDVVQDVEQRAAEDRLACYRALAENLPADGGTPRPAKPSGSSRATSGTARATTASVKKKVVERPVAVCSTCFTALPATGVCDYCD